MTRVMPSETRRLPRVSVVIDDSLATYHRADERGQPKCGLVLDDSGAFPAHVAAYGQVLAYMRASPISLSVRAAQRLTEKQARACDACEPLEGDA